MEPLKIKQSDDIVTENEAIERGIELLKNYKPTGTSDFDKGMKILQDAIRRKCETTKDKTKRSRGCESR